MSDRYLGEIRIFSFGGAPAGWARCTGDLIPIGQNPPLFKLLGTTFGFDPQGGRFGLPDLRGRAPVHVGGPIGRVGAQSGEEGHTLTAQELARHNHVVSASEWDAVLSAPWFLAAVNNAYGPPVSTTSLRSTTVSSTGGGQSHTNMQPSIVLNFCISLFGLAPSGT